MLFCKGQSLHKSLVLGFHSPCHTLTWWGLFNLKQYGVQKTSNEHLSGDATG